MTDLPIGDSLFTRYVNLARKYYYTKMNKPNSIFVFEIGEHNIVSGWTKVTEYDTVNFNESTYDRIPCYHMFGYEILFVRKGVRPPIHFSNYVKMFENVEDDKGKRLALDGRLANIKMNSRNAAEFVREHKNADIIYILSIGAVGLLLLIVAGLFDVIHLPATTEAHNSFAELLNYTRYNR